MLIGMRKTSEGTLFERETFSAARPGAALWLVLAFFFAGACAQVPPPVQVPPSEPKPAEALAQRIADTVADERVLELTPVTVRRWFFDLVELMPSPPTEFVWTFAGSEEKIGLRWCRAEFRHREPGKEPRWRLLHVAVGIAPPENNYAGLHRMLSKRMTDRLGPPVQRASQRADKRSFWRVGLGGEVWVSDGMFQNPLLEEMEHVVLVELAVLPEIEN